MLDQGAIERETEAEGESQSQSLPGCIYHAGYQKVGSLSKVSRFTWTGSWTSGLLASMDHIVFELKLSKCL